MAKITVSLPDNKKVEVEVGSLAQEETLKSLLKIMDSHGKAASLSTQASQREVNSLGDAASASAEALEETAVSFEEVSDAVDASAKNMRDASSKFKKDLSSSMFSNTKSLFSGMSSPMNFLKDSASDVGQGLQGLLKSSAAGEGAMAGFSSGLLRAAGPIGLLISAVSSVVGFLVGRAKKNIEMYDNALKSGATFAGGMEEFRSTVTNSSLNLDDFNSVMSKNATTFAQFGGSVGQGATKFAAVSKEVGKYGVQFRNLGYSAEEMGGVQADYMAMLQQTGELTGKNARSDAEVAKGAMGYAANLKLMSAYTGKSIEQLKAEQAEKARDFKYMLAARQLAKDNGITYTQAMQSIQSQVAKGPAFEALILSQAANRGKALSAEAAMMSSTMKGTAAALNAEREAEMEARRRGVTDENEINIIKAKVFAAHKDQMAADIAEGSRFEAYGNALMKGVSTAGDATVQAGAQVMDLTNLASTAVATAEAQAKTQKDTQGLAAKNNLASATMYDANKRLLDITDDLALKGMALFQDAIMKFAVAVFKMFHITMPKSLQEFSDASDAAAKAAELKAKADRDAAAAKVAEEKTGAMDPAAIAALTKTVMQQGNIGYRATKESGLFGSSDKIERKAGESDEDYNRRNLEEIKKALLAKSADPKFAGNIKMELDANIAKLRQTDMGKGMTDAELQATLKAMYKQQGLAISDDFKRVMTLEQKQAEDAAAAAAAEEKARAAAAAAGIETTPAASTPPAPAEAGPTTQKLAEGGIASGAKTGFPAILHGTEAVVPLPDNKSIPVNIKFPENLLSGMNNSPGQNVGVSASAQASLLAGMTKRLDTIPAATDPAILKAFSDISINEKSMEPEGGMFSDIRSGFESILKNIQDSLPSAEKIEKSIAGLTETPTTASLDNVRTTMIEVRDLIKSQNELFADLLDQTKTGVRVQKDIRNLNY